MFDTHDKQERWDPFESGSEKADPVAQPGSTEENDVDDDRHPRQPRMVCVGFAVFRI